MAKNATTTGFTPSLQLLDKSYGLIKKNLRIFAIMYALPVLYSLSQVFTSNSNKKVNVDSGLDIPTGALLIIPIVFLLFIFLAVIYQTMLVVLELKVTKENGSVGFKQLWKEARPYWGNIFVLGLLSGLYVLAGLILFIVPGLILLRRYYLAAYFMIDKDLSPKEAMRQSATASKQASGYIWGLLGVTLLFALTGIIPFIGALISALLGAAYSVAPALRYQEIKNLATASDK